MNEPEAIRRATPKVRWMVLVTVMVWGISLSSAWFATDGDYYRTFPSIVWVWAVAIAGSWTLGAYLALDEHFRRPDLEEVGEGELRLSRKPPKVLHAKPSIEAIDARWHAVLGAYGAFLSDIVAIADRPLLADAMCPTTERFRTQLVVTEDAHADATRNPDVIEAYLQAVQELEKTWEAATTWAKRKGCSTLEPAERTAVQRARRLLDVALSDTAYGPERRAAMHKAVELLRTVVDLPPQATAAIEHRVDRLQLGR